MSGNSISKNQIACIMAMMNKLQFAPQKEAIVSGISNGRTTSTRALTADEARDLIKWLKSQDPDEQVNDRMRKKIIWLAREMGWEKDGHADMLRIDNWCLKFGKFKKRLSSHSRTELSTLVSQFETVHRDFINKF